MTIRTDIQQPTTDGVVDLYIIDASIIGGDIHRFTPMTVEGNDKVKYQGNVYEPLPMQVTGMQRTQVGAPPKPILSVSNTNKFLQAAVILMGDLRGAEFTRIRTFRKHLDDGSASNHDAYFPLDKYIVEQKTKHNNLVIEWALSSVLDKEGSKLPHRQMLRDKGFPGLSTVRIRA